MASVRAGGLLDWWVGKPRSARRRGRRFLIRSLKRKRCLPNFLRMYLSIYIFSICLYLSVSISISSYAFPIYRIFLSISISIYLSLSKYLYQHLSVCLSIYRERENVDHVIFVGEGQRSDVTWVVVGGKVWGKGNWERERRGERVRE